MLVEYCVTYVAEVWIITEKFKRIINVDEAGFWRRCCGVTSISRIPDEEIKKKKGGKNYTNNIGRK